MDRALYIAMTGATQAFTAQAVTSNNLANASTNGFKAELETFKSLPVQGPGLPARVFVQDTGIGANLQPGSVTSTGRELDVTIMGEGWIAVQAPDGEEAYTRAGNMRVDETGLLVTGSGYPVLGAAGPITIPAAGKVEVGDDGTISIQPIGQAVNALTVLERIRLVKPPLETLVRTEFGLMRTNDGAPAAADASVRVASGSLEASNVNPTEALMRMIEVSRHYELQIKMMRTAKQNDEVSARLLSSR